MGDRGKGLNVDVHVDTDHLCSVGQVTLKPFHGFVSASVII